MFWKFVFGALVLPSFLGIEVATASLGKDNVKVLSKSTKSELSLPQKPDSQTAENSPVETKTQPSAISVKEETNTAQSTEIANIPLIISHHTRRYRRRYYRRRYRRPCSRSRRHRKNYYRVLYYHPSYYRRGHDRSNYYRRSDYRRCRDCSEH